MSEIKTLVVTILLLIIVYYVCFYTSSNSKVTENMELEESREMTIVTAGLGPEVRRLNDMENRLNHVQSEQILNTNILTKLYKKDALGDYISPGWFVAVNNVVSNPHGVSLGSVIERHYGVPRICFRAQNAFGFLGYPQDPTYLPKGEFVGFRAMTIFKIPKTGWYKFKILSDDGAKLMYQKVDAPAMQSQDNIYSDWNLLVDQWRFQSETWGHTKVMHFDQSDLVLLRFDYFNAGRNATACIKVAYTEREKDIKSQDEYTDIDFADTYCSKVWTTVPIMNVD